jgi:hypothetical protein
VQEQQRLALPAAAHIEPAAANVDLAVLQRFLPGRHGDAGAAAFGAA